MRKMTIVGLVAVLLIAAASVIAYGMGVDSTQDEIRAAEKTTEQVKEDLTQEVAVAEGRAGELEARIAACNTDSISQIFNDLMDSHSEFLSQYEAYLSDDSLIFQPDFDALTSTDGEYSESNSMADQFEAALMQCGPEAGSGT